MPARSLAMKVSFALNRASLWLYARSATGEIFKLYPSRAGEALSAWLILAWSLSTLTPFDILRGPQYEPMLRLMSEQNWGLVGTTLAVVRIFALICNGHWRPSPELRALGAFYGIMFWGALSACYAHAITHGAPDFPFRRGFYILTAFEVYACLWCGIDMHAQAIKFKRAASGLTGDVARDG